MSIEPAELFPIEFRRATVQRIARALADGSLTLDMEHSIAFNLSGQTALDTAKMIGIAWGKLGGEVMKYCSGEFEGKELDKAETRIFWEYLQLRIYNAIQEGPSQSQTETAIGRLDGRIDSTNNLLLEVLKVSKAILEILESIGKS